MERVKGWFEKSFNLQGLLLLIIAAMITAFWTSFENDKAKRDAKNEQQDEKISEQQIITYNLAKAVEQIQADQKDLRNKQETKNERYDEQFMEVWKEIRRGGKSVDMTQYKKADL